MKPSARVLLSSVRPALGRNLHLVPWLRPLFRDASICKRFQSQDSRTTAKATEPLRILFCGSDDFSCANLRALHEEHVRNPALIESIDVVVRPGKRVGRGYKKIQHPPIRDVATELNLTIHERDTFTGWDMPPNINLIIAVSFGLFVPPRLLRAAKYGGLNVHPSLLPEFRGAAPLQHTLLRRREVTGVTLQTLDHRTFDAGVILAQTPLASAYRLPAGGGCTVPELQAALTPLATEMLVQSLREGRHVQPHQPVGWHAELLESKSESPSISTDTKASTSEKEGLMLLPDASADAPKITSSMRQLFPSGEAAWERFDLGEAVLRHRVIGPLWFMARNWRTMDVKRIILSGDVEEVALNQTDLVGAGYHPVQLEVHLVRVEPGVPLGEDGLPQEDLCQDNHFGFFVATVWYSKEGDEVYLTGEESTVVRVSHLKVEGERVKPARKALAPFEEP